MGIRIPKAIPKSHPYEEAGPLNRMVHAHDNRGMSPPYIGNQLKKKKMSRVEIRIEPILDLGRLLVPVEP